MHIQYDKQGAISVITINRPEAMNALDGAASIELGEVFEDFRRDPDAKVAVLTGAGTKAFCVGVDTNPANDASREAYANSMKDGPYGPSRARMRAFLKGIDVWKPIIAAVNGDAISIGASLVLGTDIRIASPNATFCFPEVTYNQLADGGALPRLPRQIPYVHAMKLLLLGESIGAEEALRIGLVNEVVPQAQLMPRAMELAGKLANFGPEGVQMTKQAIINGQSVGLDVAMLQEALYAEMITAFRGEKEDAELKSMAKVFEAKKDG